MEKKAVRPMALSFPFGSDRLSYLLPMRIRNWLATQLAALHRSLLMAPAKDTSVKALTLRVGRWSMSA